MEEADLKLRFLKGLGNDLLLERQEVLFDQAVNRYTHKKRPSDDRMMCERMLRLRRDNVDKAVLDKYEKGRETDWPSQETVINTVSTSNSAPSINFDIPENLRPGPIIVPTSRIYWPKIRELPSLPAYNLFAPPSSTATISGQIEVMMKPWLKLYTSPPTIRDTREELMLKDHSITTLERKTGQLRMLISTLRTFALR